MTAGIFHEHGVWFGSCRPPSRLNPKGYFESNRIKGVMKAHFPSVPTSGMAAPVESLRDDIITAIARDNYPGGPWAFKGTAMYYPALHAAFPDAHVVCVIRDPRGIFESTRKTNMFGKDMTDTELMWNILEHQRVMDNIPGAHIVYTDELVEGKFDSVLRALDGCGLKADVKKVEQFVDPKHWHYKR